MSPIPIQEWMEYIPDADNPGRAGHNRALVVTDIVDKPPPRPKADPFTHFRKRQKLAAGPAHEPEAPAAEAAEPVTVAALDADTLIELNAQLEIDRAEIEDAFADVNCANFVCGPRQTPKNVERCGHVTDSIRAKAESPGVTKFLKAYQMQQTVTFTVLNEMYTREDIRMMACLWCSRMQYFFDVAVLRPGVYRFTAADIAGFVEPPRVLAHIAAGVNQHVQDRIDEIRAMAPTNPI